MLSSPPGIGSWNAEHRQVAALAAEGDGVDAHAVVAREFGGLERIELAGIADAVGEQDHHAFAAPVACAGASPRGRSHRRSRSRARPARPRCPAAAGARCRGRASAAPARRPSARTPAGRRDRRRGGRGNRRAPPWPRSAGRRRRRRAAMSSSPMLPDRSTASIRSRPLCGGCTASPSCCGRAAATHSRIQASHSHHEARPPRAKPPLPAIASRRAPYGTLNAADAVRAAGSSAAHQPRQRQRQQQPWPGEAGERRPQHRQPATRRSSAVDACP